MFNRFCGLDTPDINISTIMSFHKTFWNALIWGSIAREGINIGVTFSTNWLKATSSCIKYYTLKGCKLLVYFSSAIDAHERIYIALNEFFIQNSLERDVVSIIGND